MSPEEKLKAANEMIKIIANHGRRFFYDKDSDTVACLRIKNKRIYFFDEWTKQDLYLHTNHWRRKFHHGGTLQRLIEDLRDYIQGKDDFPLWNLGPWPDYLCGGDLWGYGKEQMEIVRKECEEIKYT